MDIQRWECYGFTDKCENGDYVLYHDHNKKLMEEEIKRNNLEHKNRELVEELKRLSLRVVELYDEKENIKNRLKEAEDVLIVENLIEPRV